jgi:3-oxoadipate enol-lactonase
MPYAHHGGIALYYELHGTSGSPPLLLIAGRSTDHTGWRPQIDQFRESFRVLVFDHRGVGRSDTPEDGYTTQEMARDTLAVMSHAGIERAHIVGASMGGYIAQELTLLAPDRVGALVLAGTVTHTDSWMRNIWALSEALATRDELREARVRQSLLFSFSPDFLNQPEQLERLIQQGLQQPSTQSPPGRRGHLAACASHDTRKRLMAIRAPTLVLAGEYDLLVPVARVYELAQSIPNAQFRVLPGGHAFMTEEPEPFNAAVRSFLDHYEGLLR